MYNTYKIINKITNNINICNNDIEQGFLLDNIIDILDYKYPFLDYKIIYKNNDIIIEECKKNDK